MLKTVVLLHILWDLKKIEINRKCKRRTFIWNGNFLESLIFISLKHPCWFFLNDILQLLLNIMENYDFFFDILKLNISKALNVQKPNQELLTTRNVQSFLLSCSSMHSIMCERDNIPDLTSSIFFWMISLFCSSSFLSAVVLAASSLSRNWWSFSNASFILFSVCWLCF